MPLTLCVPLGTLFNLSYPLFIHLKTDANIAGERSASVQNGLDLPCHLNNWKNGPSIWNIQNTEHRGTKDRNARKMENIVGEPYNFPKLLPTERF